MDLGEFGLIHERAKHIRFLYTYFHNLPYSFALKRYDATDCELLLTKKPIIGKMGLIANYQ